MIRYLLPREGRFYRANLHSHSTDSDGHFTPEELVEGYRAHGYSILAISDHNKFIDRSALCRDDFLVLNSYEFNHAPYALRGRSVHMGLIARSPAITEAPELLNFASVPESTSDAAFTAAINENVRRASEAGFMPIYNHMRWSLENEADLLGYEGFWGMEIFNYFSEVLGIEEFNLPAYLAKLRRGEKMWAIMADDNHNFAGERAARMGLTSPWDLSFGGFIDIKAPDLGYETIIASLDRGDFYSSMGPTFEELYIEDGVLHVRCSPVRSIAISTMNRNGNQSRGHRSITITEAAFELREDVGFVVVNLTDEHGLHAVSQPYWL